MLGSQCDELEQQLRDWRRDLEARRAARLPGLSPPQIRRTLQRPCLEVGVAGSSGRGLEAWHRRSRVAEIGDASFKAEPSCVRTAGELQDAGLDEDTWGQDGVADARQLGSMGPLRSNSPPPGCSGGWGSGLSARANMPSQSSSQPHLRCLPAAPAPGNCTDVQLPTLQNRGRPQLPELDSCRSTDSRKTCHFGLQVDSGLAIASQLWEFEGKAERAAISDGCRDAEQRQFMRLLELRRSINAQKQEMQQLDAGGELPGCELSGDESLMPTASVMTLGDRIRKETEEREEVARLERAVRDEDIHIAQLQGRLQRAQRVHAETCRGSLVVASRRECIGGASEAPSDASTATSSSAALVGEAQGEVQYWHEQAEMLERELRSEAAVALDVQDRIHWLRVQLQRQPGDEDERLITIRSLLSQLADHAEAVGSEHAWQQPSACSAGEGGQGPGNLTRRCLPPAPRHV